MFHMTANDLASKTDRQLAALFQETVKGLTTTRRDAASAQSLLTMIRIEIAKREPSP